MLISLRYSLVFHEIDAGYEGFFPDLPEIGNFTSNDVDELMSIANKKMRLYCVKHIKHLPTPSRSFDLNMKYVRELNYKMITILEGIDEYHNGENHLIDDVCEEFEQLLTLKEIDLLEDYIARYYKNSSLDDPRFNLLVFEYYALVKNDRVKAHDAFDYYENGTFSHNKLPKLELIDWLISNDGDLDALTILDFMKKEIKENENSNIYKNEELEKEIDRRMTPLLKQYPKFLEKI